ncbi:MAG: hypothetical protein JWM87_3659 [Candidatus Eremiobacteraeota bacterium]|nr:hypothetical protein [Candidatus Eremiobacteraeota bacterium]
MNPPTDLSYPTLAHAPIVEGLIDIQIMPPLSEAALPALQRLHSNFPEYPLEGTKINVSGQFLVSSTSATSVSQTIIGYQFGNSENTRVLQVRLDGATASILAPYTTFTDLENDARRLWAIYRDAIGLAKIARIAVRNINRIELPTSPFDFNEYILTTPEVAPALPQALSAYSMRLMIPDNASTSQAIVTQIFEGVADAGHDALPLIFDIDAFQVVELDARSDEAWEIVQQLRNFKNRIFFGSITDKLRRQFE